jgi:hypothetical protein
MKPEYDFSEGTRGKFHRADLRLRRPVYLDAEVQQFVERIAEAKQSDITTVVNDLLRSDMRVAEIVR